ncbi:MAG TPA: hypothetical protein VFO93_16490 [Hymenobacter sp.]|uniref:hypothetical protein n=1 Tax=Hymenobacter sp. TaxID=1898978 RepID=UPI002D7E58EC|nr:hypothetical protein [Hymenobacter sp.]HET9505144.1 hypothetical protein [Hymenobacter sp.]
MIDKGCALQVAKLTLKAKNIPFRESSCNQKIVTDNAVSKWHISFDIPMPLGMQDECFTVVVNAETGISEGVITPTALF